MRLQSRRIGFARVVLGLAILSGLRALDMSAQSVGAFVPTGQMINPRQGTAVLLEDGRVLVAGGTSCNALGHCDTLASAELYDPATDTFSFTGNMTSARSGSAAAVLPDGRVLIAGGTSTDNGGRVMQLDSAELYDPATGTFTATGDVGPLVASATLLSNGKVLIIRIVDSNYSAEMYDPATGVSTSPGALMGDGNGDPVLLKDGRVLISGHLVSIYEITSDSLKLVASYPVDTGDQSATLLMNGKVLLAGGCCSDGLETTDLAYIYDPHRGTIEATGLLAISRSEHEALLLSDGRVLILGGYPGRDYVVGANHDAPDAEAFDPSTGGFIYAGTNSVIGSTSTPATLLLDGRVLISGGTAQLYIPPLRAVSAASLTGPLAPESVALLFGSRMATTTASADPLAPPTNLGGISLRVRDSSGAANLAHLFFVSPTEIRFEVPPGTTLGSATLELVNAPTQPSPVAAQVQNVAPGIFSSDDNLVAGLSPTLPLLAQGTIGLDGNSADLVVYGTGIRNFSTLGNVRATIGGASVTVLSAGADSNVPGLDEVKIRVPSDFQGRGFQDLVLTVDGIPSNATSVQILGARESTPASAPRSAPSPRR